MNLEAERLILQIKKVEVAKHEMSFKILEKKEDIKRLETEIENQEKSIIKLNEKLKGLSDE